MPSVFSQGGNGGGGSGSNASVGPNNATAPTSSTEIGSIDSGGKLQGASASNPIPVTLEADVVAVDAQITGHIGGILDALIGGTAPANALLVGGSDGTDLRALNSDASGNIGVNIENTPTVAIGSATPAGFHISSNAVQAIKASAGVLRGYFLDNTANAATTYFQFFNVASGSVSLGSTAALFVIPVPAGLAANLAMAGGWTFSTAMSFAATTTYNGSTAPSSAVDCVIAYL